MDSEDEEFDFNPETNFDMNQEKMETEITNSQNYNLLKDLSKNFLQDLSTNIDFKHPLTWNSYYTEEPIAITISSTENKPGLGDIINPRNESFFSKIACVFSSIFTEIEKLLPSNSLNPFEFLYPLAMYNETIDSESEAQSSITLEQGAEQIAGILPYLKEVYDKVTTLLSYGINLTNQLTALYQKETNLYDDLYRHVHLDIAFEYLGLIAAYFNAVDCIVDNRGDLRIHWQSYRTIFYKIKKGNIGEYNMNEEQKNRLEKIIKRVDACVLESKCFTQCVLNYLKHTGKFTPSLSGHNFLNQNQGFLYELTKYLRKKINKLASDDCKLFDSRERLQLFSTISLVSLYASIVEYETGKPQYEKDIFKSAWNLLYKCNTVPIIANISINLGEYLKKQNAFKSGSYDIKDVNKKMGRAFDNYAEKLPSFIHNYQMSVIAWITNFESIFLEPKKEPVVDENAPKESKKLKAHQEILDKCENKMNYILQGLSMADNLKMGISTLLEHFVFADKTITQELITNISFLIEIIKIIEEEFQKMMPYIAMDLDLLNRSIYMPAQLALKTTTVEIDRKLKETKNHTDLYKDIKESSMLMFKCLMAVPSKMRRIINRICLPVLTHFDEKSFEKVPQVFEKIEILNELSKEVKRACECQFMFYYQEMIPEQLKGIYETRNNHLIYYAKSLNDTEIPLLHLIYQEDKGEKIIKKNREHIYKLIEENFLKPLVVDIEKDIRMQVHASFIELLNSTKPEDLNLRNLLKIGKFRLFDLIVDTKRYVEEMLNIRFYKLTALNLNDWNVYQQLRLYAKVKYNLILHEIFLPCQSLDRGNDIITIIKQLPAFVNSFSHNLLSQIFVKKINEKDDSNVVKIIGVPHILNSLYTNGTGIINSVINSEYQFLKAQLKKIVNFLSDDKIISPLIKERKEWERTKADLKYYYPYSRAEEVKERIWKTFEESPSKYQFMQIVTHIGNAVALTHTIRTALRDYNSHNSNLVNCDGLDELGKLIDNVSFDEDDISANINANFKQNSLNSFKDSTQMFLDTMSALKQTGLNNINYLLLLVNSFGKAFNKEKIQDIDLFMFLFPAATIKHIETMIIAKKNLSMISKKTKQEEAYFCDDGFIIGMVYIMRVFGINKLFDGLNWFKSAIKHFEDNKAESNKSSKKSSKKNNYDDMNANLLGFQSDTYLREINHCQYTYASASILFTE
ncbi:MAG: hypothetical protein MJ252_02805 [archaeon]|nr:hypothetical protein [archaeon]